MNIGTQINFYSRILKILYSMELIGYEVLRFKGRTLIVRPINFDTDELDFSLQFPKNCVISWVFLHDASEERGES
jgi:hypothetical protein